MRIPKNKQGKKDSEKNKISESAISYKSHQYAIIKRVLSDCHVDISII